MLSFLRSLFQSNSLHKTTPTSADSAGVYAETIVAHILDEFVKLHPSWVVQHGVLFVFNEGQRNEFSCEIDHLLITDSVIFVIETKYKSGRVFVHANKSWKVVTKDGAVVMRNGLHQARKHAQILRKQFNLNDCIVPIVTFVGNETDLHHKPYHVCLSTHLVGLVSEILKSQSNRLDVDSMYAQMSPFITTGAAAKQKHLEHCKLLQNRAQYDEVQTT